MYTQFLEHLNFGSHPDKCLGARGSLCPYVPRVNSLCCILYMSSLQNLFFHQHTVNRWSTSHSVLMSAPFRPEAVESKKHVCSTSRLPSCDALKNADLLICLLPANAAQESIRENPQYSIQHRSCAKWRHVECLERDRAPAARRGCWPGLASSNRGAAQRLSIQAVQSVTAHTRTRQSCLVLKNITVRHFG